MPVERERFLKECPSTLDIIKIDNHWAQIASCSERDEAYTLIFLKNKQVAQNINLKKYKLVKEYRQTVKRVMGQGENFTPSELEAIRWGPEQEKNPELKLLVTVFGEYEKK